MFREMWETVTIWKCNIDKTYKSVLEVLLNNKKKLKPVTIYTYSILQRF